MPFLVNEFSVAVVDPNLHSTVVSGAFEVESGEIPLQDDIEIRVRKNVDTVGARTLSSVDSGGKWRNGEVVEDIFGPLFPRPSWDTRLTSTDAEFPAELCIVHVAREEDDAVNTGVHEAIDHVLPLLTITAIAVGISAIAEDLISRQDNVERSWVSEPILALLVFHGVNQPIHLFFTVVVLWNTKRLWVADGRDAVVTIVEEIEIDITPIEKGRYSGHIG